MTGTAAEGQLFLSTVSHADAKYTFGILLVENTNVLIFTTPCHQFSHSPSSWPLVETLNVV